MSSVSKLTLSLSVLVLISLHAMEENDNSSGKKNNLKSSGEYVVLKKDSVIDAEFRKEATTFLLKQTFHVLKTGNIAEYITDHLTPGGFKKIKGPINCTEKAQSIACNRIDEYFLGKINRSKNKKNINADNRLKEIVANSHKICIGTETSEVQIASNEFSAFVIIENHKKFTKMNTQFVKTFNKDLLGSIQHRVAIHCFKSLVETNQFLNKEMLTFQSSADNYKKESEVSRKEAEERLAEAQMWRKRTMVSVPTCIVVGGSVATAALYKAGYINTDKVTQDANNIIDAAKGFLGNNS